MSDYTPVEDYSAKDALSTGDPDKLILGADIDSETAAIQTAIATKYDSSDLASQAQAEAGTNNTALMTPLRVEQQIADAVPAATTSATGVIELATGAEVTTGTDTARAVVPADLKTELDKKIDDISGGTNGNLCEVAAGGQVADSGIQTAKTPQVDEVVTFEKAVVWDAANDEGTGGSVTIDWTLGNKAKYTVNATSTLTFTAPGGPANLILVVTNSGASRPLTFPATVKWAGGTQPAESTGVDLYSFYYDGTNYYGGALLDCS